MFVDQLHPLSAPQQVQHERGDQGREESPADVFAMGRNYCAWVLRLNAQRAKSALANLAQRTCAEPGSNYINVKGLVTMSRPVTVLLPKSHRHDVVQLLSGDANVGVELGIAEGVFSERMVQSGRFARFIGIDMYADDHDVAQYKRALKRIGIWSDYKLLRMRFDEAIDLFEDESLDFVYVDGYAHGGEEGGRTIFEWFRKVRVGGLIAGDDYSPAWPLVVKAVDTFALQLGQVIHLTEVTEADNPYCRYPTWAIRKERSVALAAPAALVREGQRANARVLREKEGGWVKQQLKAWLPPTVIAQLKRLRSAGS